MHPLFSLEGQVALVTGAGSLQGIGFATAKLLAEMGAKVAVAATGHRIHGEQLVEHEVIHPLITVLGDDDLFGVVTLTYEACFATFASKAAESLAKA